MSTLASVLITNIVRPALRDEVASGTWGTDLPYACDAAQKDFVAIAPEECLHELLTTAVLATTAAGDTGSPFWSVAYPSDFLRFRACDVRTTGTSGEYYPATVYRMDEKFLPQRRSLLLAATEEQPVVFLWDKVYGGPKPDADDASGGRIWYIKQPTLIDATTDPFTINDVYVPALSNHVLAWAFFKNNRMDAAGLAWQKWLTFLRGIGVRLTDLEKLSPPWAPKMAAQS